MRTLLLCAEVFAYLFAARLIVRRLTGTTREVAFALVNLVAYAVILAPGTPVVFAVSSAVYLGVVGVFYLMMRAFADRQDARAWLAFFAPIVALILLRFVPTSVYAPFSQALRQELERTPDLYLGGYLLGFSYLVFRCSHLVIEVRNGTVAKPGWWEYLGYSFFVPIMTVGPINAYSNHRRGFAPEPPLIPVDRSLLRILVGLVKFLFLGNLFNQLSYSGLLLDDHHHPWMDLPIAAVCYYLFLYCNFSGFCDLAIGGAGLIGIPVTENFNDPFASRNMREFWNRWHITLSAYMRDTVFSPLSKFLTRTLGPERINLAISLTVLVVFLLIGIWHGTGWNYAVFGLLQAVGVIATHYYTLGLKRWLGREQFKAYNANPWIRAAAVTTTFCYYAGTLFFFANSAEDMRQIWAALR